MRSSVTRSHIVGAKRNRATVSRSPAFTAVIWASSITNLVSGSTYWALGSEQRAILAGRLALGSLVGAPLAPLPTDQRIYVGGGGSVRPYGYQMAGPLDSGNVPIGG
jgi:translocation and assembly module TamA